MKNNGGKLREMVFVGGTCCARSFQNSQQPQRIDPFTVDWNNEIGFAPEYLYEISQAA